MQLLVNCESWTLTHNNGKSIYSEYCGEMSDDYVELLKAMFEKDYNEEVVVVYIDDSEEEVNEFTIIR